MAARAGGLRLDVGAGACLDGQEIELEDGEVDGEDEEPEEGGLEERGPVFKLRVEGELPEDAEGDEELQEIDGFADGGHRPHPKFIDSDDGAEVQVVAVPPEGSAADFRFVFGELLLDGRQRELLFLEKAQDLRVVEHHQKVHQRGQYVEDDRPAVAPLLRSTDEGLLVDKNHKEYGYAQEGSEQRGAHQPPEAGHVGLYEHRFFLVGREDALEVYALLVLLVHDLHRKGLYINYGQVGVLRGWGAHAI